MGSNVECKLHGAAGRPGRGAATNNPGLTRARSSQGWQRRTHRRLVKLNYFGCCRRFHAFRRPFWCPRLRSGLKVPSATALPSAQSILDPDEPWMNSYISLSPQNNQNIMAAITRCFCTRPIYSGWQMIRSICCTETVIAFETGHRPANARLLFAISIYVLVS